MKRRWISNISLWLIYKQKHLRKAFRKNTFWMGRKKFYIFSRELNIVREQTVRRLFSAPGIVKAGLSPEASSCRPQIPLLLFYKCGPVRQKGQQTTKWKFSCWNLDLNIRQNLTCKSNFYRKLAPTVGRVFHQIPFRVGEAKAFDQDFHQTE